MNKKKCGFVAIVGRPNVGKSTLMNQLVGEKLAGVSAKPQTTRNAMRGILTRGDSQVIFLDTPGVHKPKDLLGNWMKQEVERAVEGADLIYWLVLPGDLHREDQMILEWVKETKLPVLLLINQVDRFEKEKILPVIEHYSKQHTFTEYIPISALKGIQTDIVIEKTFEHLPEGEFVFPEDQLSDQTERFIVSELIREKIFRLTKQEIPYACTVVVDEFKDRNETLTDISATVVVEKDSQRAIVIGKGGDMMKRIGEEARHDIEQFLDRKVYLKLWAKTYPRWKDDHRTMQELGFE